MLLTASLIPSSSRRRWKSSPDYWSALQSSWAVVRYTNSLNTSTSSPIEWMKGLTSLRYETSCLSAGLHQLDPGQLSVSMSARWHYLFLQISYANYRSWTRLLVGSGFAKVTGSPHGCGLLRPWGQGRSPSWTRPLTQEHNFPHFRIVMSSASLSEDSLIRVCGEDLYCWDEFTLVLYWNC